MKLKKIHKMLISFVASFMVVTLLFATAALAAPDTLSSDVYSTRSGLLSLKVPQYVVSTTTNKNLAISATALPGTTVTVYRYSPQNDMYIKAHVGGAPLEAVVGPTMLFAGQVELVSGVNKFIIRAEAADGTYTVTRFDVTLLNEGFMDRIKSIIDFKF